MTPRAHWPTVREIFEAALDKAGEELEAFLAASCSGDAVLRGEVERLLAAESESARFLAAPVVPSLLADRASSTAASAPARIGPYAVEGILGEGGTGTVYRAVDRSIVPQRLVAIKVMGVAMESPGVVARFEHEREILSSLDHPGIAKLLQGGEDENGRPFLVLEHVEGEPITDYCERQRLSVSACIDLFCSVCDTVAYAHRHLVVHRDIKPSNILVTPAGEPKLLDFGLAKLLSLLPTQDGFRTTTRSRMLTPEYASPEQLRGETIATTSDVYSLGIVLFELLTGRRPYELEWRAPTDDAFALVAGPPSRFALSPAIPDDLARIVGMAIRPEPTRRYQSVEALADDLRRFRSGLPVKARPDTVRYRMKKFYRRHRVGVSATLAVLLALVGGVVTTSWQAQRAERARTLADQRYHQIRNLATALLVEFEQPISSLPGSTPIREALVVRALRYLTALEHDSADDPSLQRELAVAYTKVGEVQLRGYELEAGDTDGALRSFLRALEIREALARREPTADDLDAVADSLWHVAQTLGQMGRHSEYMDYADRAVSLRRRLVADDPSRPQLRSRLAQAYQTFGTALLRADRCSDALEVFRLQQALQRELAEVEPANLAYWSALGAAYRSIGLAHEQCGQLPAAVESWRAAEAVDERAISEEPNVERHRTNLARTLSHLGRALCKLGAFEEGIGHLRDAISQGEELRATDPKNALVRERLAAAYRDLGTGLADAGRSEEGIAALERAEALLEDWSQASPTNTFVQYMLADVYFRLGQAQEPRAGLRPSAIEPWPAACRWYEKSAALWNRLREQGRVMPVNVARVEQADAALAGCRRPGSATAK